MIDIEKHGPWTLVTGASSGIGETFARQLAPMGMNLFAINAVTKDITIFDIYKGSAPFLIAPIVLITLMIAYPQIVMWLPNHLN